MITKQTLLNTLDIYKDKLGKIYIKKKEVTQAQYDALSEEEKNNGTMYLITDASDLGEAKQIAYSNKNSGLDAINVQGAIDELKMKFSNGSVSGGGTTSGVPAEADQIYYKNTTSGLDAANVQGAIDEVASTYLPKTGGTVTGVLTVNETVQSVRTGTEQPYLKVQNSLRNGGVMISNSGKFGLWDNSNNKWLIYNDENGLNKFGNSIWESTLAWRLGDGTEASGYVALRRMGNSGSYQIGLPYTAPDGSVKYNNLINSDGSRAWVARSGDTISGNLIVEGTIKGKMAASDFRSYNDAGIKFNQYGNIQTLSDASANTWEILNYSGTPTFKVQYSTGNVTIAHDNTTNAQVTVQNSLRTGRLLANSSGYLGIYDDTKGYFLIYGDTSNNVKIGGTNVTHSILIANGYALYFGKGLTNTALTSLTPRTTSGAGTDDLVLGAADARWYQVYCRNSAMSTSDIRDKNIFELDNRYKDLFMKLNTVGFTWKDETNGIVHIGLGAQPTEQAALDCGIKSNEFGAIIHDHWTTPNKDGRTDRYSIAYDEIAMLTIPVVQDHEKEIKSLKEEIAELKSIVQKLTS